MSWVLIVNLYGATIMFPTPFKTEQSCRATGENMKAEYRQGLRGDTGFARYVCVRRADA